MYLLICTYLIVFTFFYLYFAFSLYAFFCKQQVRKAKFGCSRILHALVICRNERRGNSLICQLHFIIKYQYTLYNIRQKVENRYNRARGGSGPISYTFGFKLKYGRHFLTIIFGIKSTRLTKILIFGIWGLGEVSNRCYSFWFYWVHLIWFYSLSSGKDVHSVSLIYLTNWPIFLVQSGPHALRSLYSISGSLNIYSPISTIFS